MTLTVFFCIAVIWNTRNLTKKERGITYVFLMYGIWGGVGGAGSGKSYLPTFNSFFSLLPNFFGRFSLFPDFSPFPLISALATFLHNTSLQSRFLPIYVTLSKNFVFFEDLKHEYQLTYEWYTSCFFVLIFGESSSGWAFLRTSRKQSVEKHDFNSFIGDT